MKTTLEIISEIINSKYIERAKNNQHILNERNEPNYPQTLLRTKGITHVFSFDKDEDLLPFFVNNKEDLKNVCDYVILCHKKGQCYMFLVELKSRNPRGAYKQIYAAKVFSKYLENMAIYYSEIFGTKINRCHINIRGIVLLTDNKLKIQTSPKVKYKEHRQYDYKYVIRKAGTEIRLENFCV